MIKVITREISKLIMFTIVWAIPVLLAKMFGSVHFLWLFALSAIMTGGIFSHYEDVAKFESLCSFDEDENVDCNE